MSENLTAFKLGATLVELGFAAGMPVYLLLRAYLRTRASSEACFADGSRHTERSMSDAPAPAAEHVRIRLEGRLETLEQGLATARALIRALREDTELTPHAEAWERHLEARAEALAFSRQVDAAQPLRLELESAEAEVRVLVQRHAEELGTASGELRALVPHFPILYRGTFGVSTGDLSAFSVLRGVAGVLLGGDLGGFDPYVRRKAPLILTRKVLVVDEARYELTELSGVRRTSLFADPSILFKSGEECEVPYDGPLMGAFEKAGVPRVW